MPKCSCSGSTCSCLVLDGIGTTVRGTGSAGDPYYIDLNTGQLGLSDAIVTSDSASIKFTNTGSGDANDPIIISATVRLFSPDGSAWSPSISNLGTVTWGRVV